MGEEAIVTTQTIAPPIPMTFTFSDRQIGTVECLMLIAVFLLAMIAVGDLVCRPSRS